MFFAVMLGQVCRCNPLVILNYSLWQEGVGHCAATAVIGCRREPLQPGQRRAGGASALHSLSPGQLGHRQDPP